MDNEDCKIDMNFFNSGEIYTNEWKLDGEFHRIDGPAVATYRSSDNVILSEVYYFKGMNQRKAGPAIIEYYESGKVKHEQWIFANKLHRTDGPAATYFNECGKIRAQHWLVNGKHHREDGPAYIKYDVLGNSENEAWFFHNKHHRTDGPAVIGYLPSGDIESQKWYVNDELINLEEWLEENNYSLPLDKDQQVHFILTFG